MWFHYLSCKFGRLLLPFALLAIAITSLWLPAVWMVPVIAGQAILYALAVIDLWIPEKVFLKKVSSPTRTFAVMMIAAVCALSVFFVSPQRLWTPTKTRTAGV
jgi:hypothetical protein